jgi:hypothetical protein
MTLDLPLDVTSKLLDSSRKVWIQPAVSGPASDCLIFLDGELYIDRVKAPGIVRDLQLAGQLPPVSSIYVSNLDAASRHADFTCNESYSSFLATDLCRWVEQNAGKYDRTFLCGLRIRGNPPALPEDFQSLADTGMGKVGGRALYASRKDAKAQRRGGWRRETGFEARALCQAAAFHLCVLCVFA